MTEFLVSLAWFLLFAGGGVYLAYQRIDLRTSTIATGLALLAYTIFGNGWWLWLLVLWALFGVMVIPNLIELRREKITRPANEVRSLGRELLGPGTSGAMCSAHPGPARSTRTSRGPSSSRTCTP